MAANLFLAVLGGKTMLDSRLARYVTDADAARGYVEKLTAEPVLGVDIETYPKSAFRERKGAALDPYCAEIRLVSVAARDGRVAVFDLQQVPVDVLAPLSKTKWAVFNGSFEYRHLTHVDLVLPRLHDVQLLDRLVSHQMHRKLVDVVDDWLQFSMDKTEQVGDWAAPELSEQQIHYAALDALATVRAAPELLHRVNQAGQRRLYDTWCTVLPVLSTLQLQGQTFDWSAHEQLIEHWQQEKDSLLAALREHLGAELNPNSGKQLGEWLLQNLDGAALKHWPKTPKGQLKTNADTLALFADLPAIQPLLRYKAVAKLLSTYGPNYLKHRHPVTDRLHPEFRLGQTVSGRICAAHPNTQNPPRLEAFRALFVPPADKVFVGADFGQIELRVAALLSKDRTMLQAYERGDDLHRLTAAAVAGIEPNQVTKEQRTAAKAVNFGNLYGQGARGLARQAQLDYGVAMTPQQAQQALNQFHLTYYTLAGWKRQQVGQAMQFRQVKTRLGLVRDFDKQGEGYLKGEAQNIPVQGSAAEVLMCALTRLPQALQGLDAQLYHNVHDELVVQVAPDDAEPASQALQQAMTAGFLDVFPEGEALINGLVDVQTGSSWAAVH